MTAKVGLTNAIPTSTNGSNVMDAVAPLPYVLRIRHRKDAYCSVIKQRQGSGTTELDSRDCTMHNALMEIPGVLDVDVLKSVAYVRFDPSVRLDIQGKYFDYENETRVLTTYTDPDWWVRYDLDALGQQTAAELDELTTLSVHQAMRIRDGWKRWSPKMLDSILGSGALRPPKKPTGSRRNSTRRDRGVSGSGGRRMVRSARKSFVTASK